MMTVSNVLFRVSCVSMVSICLCRFIGRVHFPFSIICLVCRYRLHIFDQLRYRLLLRLLIQLHDRSLLQPFLMFCSKSFHLLSFVCYFHVSCGGLHRLLLCSEATVVFVGVSCGEPGDNEQMAHSQIVVVIVFSLTFEMDAVSVLHRRPIGNAGFHCRVSIAGYHHLSRYVIVCFCLF